MIFLKYRGYFEIIGIRYMYILQKGFKCYNFNRFFGNDIKVDVIYYIYGIMLRVNVNFFNFIKKILLVEIVQNLVLNV